MSIHIRIDFSCLVYSTFKIHSFQSAISHLFHSKYVDTNDSIKLFYILLANGNSCIFRNSIDDIKFYLKVWFKIIRLNVRFAEQMATFQLHSTFLFQERTKNICFWSLLQFHQRQRRLCWSGKSIYFQIESRKATNCFIIIEVRFLWFHQ